MHLIRKGWFVSSKEDKLFWLWLSQLSWLMCVFFTACFATGCRSAKVAASPGRSAASDTLVPMPMPEAPDGSWPVDDYVRIGMPDPGRLWSGADYRNCRDVLYNLDRTNRAALPRMESSKSAPVFARLINATNTLFLADRFLPSAERIRSFSVVLNRLPAFQDIYRSGALGPVFHRESIELDHTFLRMLGAAVEWDGKPLPAAAGEAQPATFRLVELTSSYIDNLLEPDPTRAIVPRGDRFIVVGAYAAATLRRLLPWLADGTGLPVAERLRIIRYLREDMPALWPQMSSTQKHESAGDLDEILRRTHHDGVRRELELFRQQLIAD